MYLKTRAPSLSILLFVFFLIHSNALFAQNFSDSTFLSKGGPILSVFTNFSRTFNKNNEVYNQFQITRAFLGYNYQLNEHFSTELILDVVQDTTEQVTILRNAYLRYHDSKFTVSMGMIPTLQVMIHDEFWGYRYLLKSYQNKYGFGPSADIGISSLFEIKKIVYLDASILNGSGYQHIQTDSTLKFSIGATLFPSRNFKMRIYYDFMTGSNEQTLSAFAGYRKNKISVGMEWDYQFNHSQTKGENMWGGSLFSTYTLSDKTCLMARYDLLTSNQLNGVDWNSANDGQLILFGLEHIFSNNIRLAPNIRLWNPSHSSSWSTGLYINLKFNI